MTETFFFFFLDQQAAAVTELTRRMNSNDFADQGVVKSLLKQSM